MYPLLGQKPLKTVTNTINEQRTITDYSLLFSYPSGLIRQIQLALMRQLNNKIIYAAHRSANENAANGGEAWGKWKWKCVEGMEK